ncbi:MAG: ferredoxin [Desulfobacteraceae bacterium]|nr:MAG: ferredoxin [Desulfobacteraceae bacterium]
MGVFVRIVIDQEKCVDPDRDKAWMGVCPLGIFELRNGRPSVVEENEDECTLCGLCLDACKTGAVKIRKLYEE